MFPVVPLFIATILPPLKFSYSSDNTVDYYSGEVNRNGEFNGKGTLIDPGNYVYYGYFKNGEE